MNFRTIKSLIALTSLTVLLGQAIPAYARGFGGGGGGFHSGGGFGGYHGGFDGGFDRGGFDRGGFDHGGFDRGFAGGGFDHAFGAGSSFDHGFDRGAFTPGMAGGLGGAHANLGADGGFGGAASTNRLSNAHLNNFDENKMNVQGETVRNSFNHTTVNNINGYGHNNLAGGYHADGYGYHPYGGGAYGYHGGYGAYGYHGGYGAYGYHGYGYGYGYGYGWHGGLYGYPGGWYNPGFMEASMWTFMGLSTMTDFLGIEALTSGNRSQKSTTNITYQGDNVYINGTPATQYYNQAQQLAATANGQPNLSATSVVTVPANGLAASTTTTTTTTVANPGTIAATNPATSTATRPAATVTNPASNWTPVPLTAVTPIKEKWEPLGVYSLVEPGQKDSTTLFQLAINKEGIVRGNYMNEITNEKAQVQGALDKKTGQISWYVGTNPTTMFETDLTEIAKKNSKVVVQFGADQTQQMALIRLPAPKPRSGEDKNSEENPADTGNAPTQPTGS